MVSSSPILFSWGELRVEGYVQRTFGKCVAYGLLNLLVDDADIVFPLPCEVAPLGLSPPFAVALR